MTRITISLGEQEKLALRALADKEFRDTRAQAALIIRRELERLGLLVIAAENNTVTVGQLPKQEAKEEETNVSE